MGLENTIALLVILGIGAAIFVAMWKAGQRHSDAYDREQRRDEGRCVECGYDLRGGGHSECPECGAALTKETPTEEVQSQLDPVKLSRDWPADTIVPVPPAEFEEKETIYRSNNGREVELLVEQLRARGVWVQLRTADEYVRGGAIVSRLTSYSLEAPAGSRERAEAIVNSFRRSPAEPV